MNHLRGSYPDRGVHESKRAVLGAGLVRGDLVLRTVPQALGLVESAESSVGPPIQLPNITEFFHSVPTHKNRLI
jgi:hypothetical protein